jgi:hypothetical protein
MLQCAGVVTWYALLHPERSTITRARTINNSTSRSNIGGVRGSDVTMHTIRLSRELALYVPLRRQSSWLFSWSWG